MSFPAHPDYLISFRTRRLCELLLDYLRQMISHEKLWTALPGEVDRWWRARSKMELIHKDGGWVIEGPEGERARIAYALLDGDRLFYEMAGASAPSASRFWCMGFSNQALMVKGTHNVGSTVTLVLINFSSN